MTQTLTIPQSTVDISPGIGILSVLRHINYRPWYAIAEFVDNSIQSYHENKCKLRNIEGDDFQLKIVIELDPTGNGEIIIRDNAAGISEDNYERAFRAAAAPTIQGGLSEFGMGMKSAACWFSPTWEVRTSALEEEFTRTVQFNIDNIINDELTELNVDIDDAQSKDHFTTIRLTNLGGRMPVGKTISKVKAYLSEIYRALTNNNEISISLKHNGEIHELTYDEIDILTAPKYNKVGTHDGINRKWTEEIDFDFGCGLRATGFVALSSVGVSKQAGFSLFRRNRLIEGLGDQKYKPSEIFGACNHASQQRIFGDIHLEGFEVSHTKDGFRWDENESVFIELLKENIDELIVQSKNCPYKENKQSLKSSAKSAMKEFADSLKANAPDIVNAAEASISSCQTPENLPATSESEHKVIDFEFGGSAWRVVCELSYDPSHSDRWLDLCETICHGNDRTGCEMLGIRISLRHPFMEKFVGGDPGRIQLAIRLAAALAFAETMSRRAGDELPAILRHKINNVLKTAMWKD